MTDIITPGRRRTVFQGAGAVAGVARAIRLGLDIYGRNKRRRYNPPGEMPVLGGREGGAGSNGVYHGRFKGPVYLPKKKSVLKDGWAEKRIDCNDTEQFRCAYLGISSLPVGNLNNDAEFGEDVPSPVLAAICTGLARRYFKRYHPSKLDFMSANDTFDRVFNSLWFGDIQNNTYGLPGEPDPVPPATGADNTAIIGSRTFEVFSYVYGFADTGPDYNPPLFDNDNAQGGNPYTNGTNTAPGACKTMDSIRLGSPGSTSQGGLWTPTNSTGEYVNDLYGLGQWLAWRMMTRWKDGGIPWMLASATWASITGAGHRRTSTVTTMPLNGAVVKAKVTTVLTVHNTTKGESGGIDINNLGQNPLKGKIMYFSDIMPLVRAGITTSTGAYQSATLNNAGHAPVQDEWFAVNMRYPQQATAGTTNFRNVILPHSGAGNDITMDGTSLWSTVPRHDYFKNCTGVKDVSLEPGVMKKFDLRFKFRGPLTNWLRKENLIYYHSAASADFNKNTNLMYARGMGTSAVLMLEKRMRHDDTNDVEAIDLGYQVETYMSASVLTLSQKMPYRVYTTK